MREIRLTQGKVALVDDKDYLWIHWWVWSYASHGYAYRGTIKNGKRISHYMHREIMGAGPGTYVDHINGNKLDNRKENLRICTPLESAKNIGLKKNNKTGYIGVFKVIRHDYPLSKPFVAYIVSNYKRVHLGYYETAKEAAMVRDKAAKRLNGSFAKLNFP